MNIIFMIFVFFLQFYRLMVFLSMLTTGIIIGVWNIPGLMGAKFLPGNPRAKQIPMIMERVYIKPYVRIVPYLVGMFTGYILYKVNCVISLHGTKPFVFILILHLFLGIYDTKFHICSVASASYSSPHIQGLDITPISHLAVKNLFNKTSQRISVCTATMK